MTPEASPLAAEPLARLFERLGSSPRGLGQDEARRRLATTGPNEPAAPRPGAGVRQLLALFANPLVLVLLAASAISAFVGDAVDAVLIAVIVLLGIALNFVQSFRSQSAAERLREEVVPRATVRRDERWDEIPRRELVPGDVIRLSAGDRVPADARLVTSRDLHVQQAALTGESLPVEKEAGDLTGPAPRPAEARHTVLMGTSVVSGTAEALVVATGPATAFGEIAARLSARPPETEFERGTREFALLVTRTVTFLVLFVLLLNLALRRPALDSLLFAIALAVGLTPEFLPMITAVTLARGAVRMARRKVIVKHLAAIEDFGSLDVLCSDKTGTLTTGAMAVAASVDPLGAPSERALRLAAVNAAFETGIRSPLDAAISRDAPPDLEGWTKLDEIPFDFERRRLSVVAETAGGPVLITKGAPESVLGVCETYEADGRPVALDATGAARCRATWEGLSAGGARVLAVARRTVERGGAVSARDERAMTLVGFVTFLDPLVAGVGDALAALRRDGVAVKILTGDSELVARHVCAQVGLEAGRIVTGDEIDRMTDGALAAVAERQAVFVRVSPAQKHRILLALKSRGHVVGFLGDGINDAPSLHAADVGISVATAVDVARDAADIILLERDLGVLHAGILEGRRAFGNVMKYVLMGTSSNFGNMFSMAGAVLVLPFLPMLPTQILLNNLLYDLAQVTIPTDTVDPGFVRKPQRWSMRVIRDFMLTLGPLSSLFDFVTFFVLLRVFHATDTLFHTGWFVESLATQTLVLFIIRTSANPLRSRPSGALAATTLGVVLAGAVLPYTPLAGMLGFVPLPGAYFAFLGAVAVSYLALVELVKRRLLRRHAD